MINKYHALSIEYNMLVKICFIKSWKKYVVLGEEFTKNW